MTAATVQRKYALMKVRAGDYLLPDNDGKTIWRLARYEDGPSFGWRDIPRDEFFWGVWRWDGSGAPEVEGWLNWACCAIGLATRAEAIQHALSWKERLA